MSGPGRWFIFQGYISGKLPNAPHIRDNRSTHVKAVPSDQSFIWEITSSLIENPAELDVWIFTVVMCLMSISPMLSSSFIRYSPLLPVHLSIFVNCEMLQTSVIVILGEARYWKHILGMLSTSLWSLE